VSSSRIRTAKRTIAIAAQLSVYAVKFGRSYGTVKLSPRYVEPTPPVIYILRKVISENTERRFSVSRPSPVSAARSAIPQ